MKQMKQIFVSMLVLSAVFLSSLPLSVLANQAEAQSNEANLVNNQNVEPMGPNFGAGDDAYYRDNRVILKSRVVYVSTVDLHIGGDPEVPGGDQSSPASDEIDTALTQPIIVVTRAHSGKFLIGVVNPVVRGVQIVVRRIKSTGQIIEILNCGNWTRQLGSDYTFSCPETNGPCRPGKEETSTSEEVSPDGLTKTSVTITTDGCKTKIDRTVTTTVNNTIEVCKPGSFFNVFEAGEANGKLGKSFKVSEVIVDLPADVQQEITRVVGNKNKINYILVQKDCDNKLTVRWFAKGGGWNWLSFGIGVAVGIGLSFLIPHTRVINGIKTQVFAPVRTGISGSGNPIGGILTRPMRP